MESDVPAIDRRHGLNYALPLLWGEQPVTVGVRRPREHDYVALPSVQHARVLVPADHPPTAAMLFRHAAAGQARHVRAVRSLASSAILRLPVLRGLPLPSVGGEAPMSMLGAAREKTSPDHHVGIRLGSVRPNRKPVLLVTDPDGRPEVVAKLGWNALTRQLAEQSERRLRQLDGGDDVVLIPRSLGVTVHNGANVHWQSAIQIHEAVAVAPRALIAQALVRIASASPHHVADLAASPYAAGLRDRAAAIEHHLPGVQAVTERAIERHAVTPLAFGAWHGDFTPWNVAMVGQRLAVWDWERTADDVPVGLDAAHYHFPLASIASGRGLDAAATGRQQRLLELMGVSTSHHTAVMRLHMLELVHRFAEHERQHRLVVALMRLVERP